MMVDCPVGKKRHEDFVDSRIVGEFKKRRLSHKTEGESKGESGKTPQGSMMETGRPGSVRSILLAEHFKLDGSDLKEKAEKQKPTVESATVTSTVKKQKSVSMCQKPENRSLLQIQLQFF